MGLKMTCLMAQSDDFGVFERRKFETACIEISFKKRVIDSFTLLRNFKRVIQIF